MDFAKATAAILKASISAFGSDAIYTPVVGSPKPIRGIFENVFQMENFGDPSGIATTVPSLGIRLADLDAPPKQDDMVTIATIVYRVVDNKIDGHGGTTLILHKI